MAEAPRATSPTCPRKAVSVTLMMFWASRLNKIGKLTFQICLLVYMCIKRYLAMRKDSSLFQIIVSLKTI
ncbi:hypothetical protein JCM6294_694 [Bacteroides pyogenes DSM 20611 = JCM 6294]|uniref:Uncharacterized protein n=1 Tax=Bacteroides pyogenes DSM 20611 = JCM 6294 TaxID=1121100 RepID=W4PFD5_9BACE|nr:hypothetical protein JCM6294_694 [Bacteroides pyogenes DSM 20611 = JCM 6294]